MPNSEEHGAGGTGAPGSERVPRLSGGSGYAAWRPRMEVFLQLSSYGERECNVCCPCGVA